ncbi:ras modification protein erf4 [Ascosphaera acerosa]|nr:ras modification protein erf4 [Ascosphaera acerosa]
MALLREPAHKPSSSTFQSSTYGYGGPMLFEPSASSLAVAAYESHHDMSDRPTGGSRAEMDESREGDYDGDHDDRDDHDDEIPWGPEHPCYPHMNPHVPMRSAEYLSTRIIRIRRDWMLRGDLAPTFSNLYPEILEPVLPEREFRRVVAHVNEALVAAYDPFAPRSWLDGVLGFVTGWVWEDLGRTAVKKALLQVEDWLARWNRQVGEGSGVRIWSLRSTGYMSIDIQIPDPKLAVVPDEEHEEGRRPEAGSEQLVQLWRALER